MIKNVVIGEGLAVIFTRILLGKSSKMIGSFSNDIILGIKKNKALAK